MNNKNRNNDVPTTLTDNFVNLPDKYGCSTIDSRNQHTRIEPHVSCILDILEIHFPEILDHQLQHFVRYEFPLHLLLADQHYHPLHRPKKLTFQIFKNEINPLNSCRNKKKLKPNQPTIIGNFIRAAAESCWRCNCCCKIVWCIAGFDMLTGVMVISLRGFVKFMPLGFD